MYYQPNRCHLCHVALSSLIHFLPPAHSRHVIAEECFIIHRSSTSGYLNPPYTFNVSRLAFTISLFIPAGDAEDGTHLRGIAIFWNDSSQGMKLWEHIHGEDIITSLYLSRCVERRFGLLRFTCLAHTVERSSERKGGGRNGWGGFSASNSLVTVSRQLFIYLIFNFI